MADGDVLTRDLGGVGGGSGVGGKGCVTIFGILTRREQLDSFPCNASARIQNISSSPSPVLNLLWKHKISIYKQFTQMCFSLPRSLFIPACTDCTYSVHIFWIRR